MRSATDRFRNANAEATKEYVVALQANIATVDELAAKPKPKPKPLPKPVVAKPAPAPTPPPVAAKPAPTAVAQVAPTPAPPAPPKVDGQALEGGYLKGLRNELDSYKQYPTGRQASLERPTGEVVVSMSWP